MQGSPPVPTHLLGILTCREAGEVKAILDAERPALPAGVSVSVSNDQSIIVNRWVYELENSIMTGMFLVVIILFMFFGLKNAILISTSIPLSLFIGFIILAFSGITLNLVVLFALVLVLGIVVDDGIVVIENIYRHQQVYDKSPTQAAKDAVAEVAVPVATSTFTTLAAFIPLLFSAANTDLAPASVKAITKSGSAGSCWSLARTCCPRRSSKSRGRS